MALSVRAYLLIAFSGLAGVGVVLGLLKAAIYFFCVYCCNKSEDGEVAGQAPGQVGGQVAGQAVGKGVGPAAAGQAVVKAAGFSGEYLDN